MARVEVEIVADMLTEVLAEREEDRFSVLAEVGSSVSGFSISLVGSDEEAGEEQDKENN